MMGWGEDQYGLKGMVDAWFGNLTASVFYRN